VFEKSLGCVNLFALKIAGLTAGDFVSLNAEETIGLMDIAKDRKYVRRGEGGYDEKGVGEAA